MTAQELAIANAKKKYAAAKTQAERDAAHAEADKARGFKTDASGSVPYFEGYSNNPSTSAQMALIPKPGQTGSTPVSGIPQGSPVAKPGVIQPTVTPITPATPTNFLGDIQKMYQQLLQGQTAQLKAQTDRTVSDYNQQIADAPGTFQPLRNDVDVNTARSIQSQNEVAAAKGTAFSGGVASNISGTENTGTGLKTALNQQEVNVVQSIKKAIADTKNAASMKELELIGTNNANMIGATIDEKRRQEAQSYQASRDQVADTRYEREWTAQEEQSKNDAAARQQELEYKQYRDSVEDGKWLQGMQADAANAKAGRAVQWANLSLDREKFNWSLDPKNPQNILQGETKAYGETYKRMWDAIQSTKKGDVDEAGNPVDKPRYSNDEIYKMIMGSGLSQEETVKMVQSLGVKVPVKVDLSKTDEFWKNRFQ